MKIGILGSGIVGQTIGAKLAELGHDVMVGTRDAQKLAEWQTQTGAQVGSFAETASHGDLLFNATSGGASVDALRMAGESNINGKILVDISNPLDFSQGMPPSLSVSNTDSLGEQIQRTFPQVKVVKSLNTLSSHLMVNPLSLADGEHDIFVSGDDADAKQTVTTFLKEQFGWKHVIDLGDISTARGVEMLLPIWLRLWGALGNANFQFKIVR